MGLFGSIGRAVFGGGSKKSPQQDTSKPFHTHSSSKEPNISADVPRPDPSFMGKSQMDSFASLTDTSSVDRGGRAVDSSELDPVGIKPAMNPSLATPIDIDEQGINSLY
jgi:hypothetical protein